MYLNEFEGSFRVCGGDHFGRVLDGNTEDLVVLSIGDPNRLQRNYSIFSRVLVPKLVALTS